MNLLQKTTCSFKDKSGLQTEVAINLGHYQMAQKEGLSLRQLVNRMYPTTTDAGADSFTQMCASVGLRLSSDKEMGYKPLTMAEVAYGGLDYSAAQQGLDVTPVQSKYLFPAALVELVENKLQVDRQGAVTAFDQMMALTTSIAGRRIEQPVLDFGRNDGPEVSRAQARAQGAEPAVMMTLKASEKQLTIPETPISLVITDEAMQGTTVDQVGLVIARQASIESYARVGEDLLRVLNGDADAGSYGTGALAQVKASVYDSACTTGVLSQQAYIMWLYTGIEKRRINYIVTDIAGALAIELRTNRPTNLMNNATDRIDTTASIFYPSLVDNVKIFIVPSSVSWPVNTLMGFDSQFAMQRWINTLATYSDVERFVLRRAQAVVVSFGSKVTRYFDDAFSTLSLIA